MNVQYYARNAELVRVLEVHDTGHACHLSVLHTGLPHFQHGAAPILHRWMGNSHSPYIEAVQK
jgi:hypothetical protein